jgi:hypothetical protein
MEKNELYPELADYIFNYCGKHFWEKELKANKHLRALAKSENGTNIGMYKMLQQMSWISSDEEVLALVEGGFEAFKQRVTERIFKAHGHELELNLCPECGKIARTPLARQCRFCLHDWH